MTEKPEQETEKLEGRVIYVGSHDMGWVTKFLSSEEIADCMRQAESLFPNSSPNVWLDGDWPVVRYRGRHPIADGGSLSGGTDGEVFNNYNEKGLRIYATAGIYKAEIGKSPEGNLGIILRCVTGHQNVTHWYSSDQWERICNQPSVQRR
jgi:hypothetical protein